MALIDKDARRYLFENIFIFQIGLCRFFIENEKNNELKDNDININVLISSIEKFKYNKKK